MLEPIRKPSVWIVGTLLVLSMVGCQAAQERHDESVKNAVDRYHDTRSALVLQMAQRHFKSGDLDQAEKSLIEGMSIDADNPRLFLLSGRIALERGNLEQSFRRLDKAIEYDEALPEAYYLQGIILQRWHRFEKAYAKYEKAYELRADNVAYLMAMSEMLVANDKVKEALAMLESKVMYFEQNSGIRMAVGQLCQMTGDNRRSLEFIYEASLMQPDDIQIKEQLALARLRVGDVKDAISDLEQLCLMPEAADRADLHRMLGNAYRQIRRYHSAKKVFVRLSREHPDDAEVWITLGEIAWQQNDTSGALLASSRVMSLAPDRSEGYLLAGLVWKRRGDTDKALSLFGRAASMAPDSSDPVILRGLVLRELGKKQAAADAFKEALDRQPDDRRAQKLLAAVTQ